MTETVRRSHDLARTISELQSRVDSLPVHTHSSGIALLTDVAASGSSVTIDSIPQSYTDLELVWDVANDVGGGNRIDLRFLDSGGSDIGANNIDSYLVQLHGDGTRTDTYVSGAGTNYRAGHAGDAPLSPGRILIPRYAGSGQKTFTGSGMSYGTTAAAFSNWQSGGRTNGTAAIHEIRIVQIGGNFDAGRIRLYGRY